MNRGTQENMRRSRSRSAQARSAGNSHRAFRNFHNSASSPGTYSSRFNADPRRKQRLLSLVDLLSELTQDDGLEADLTSPPPATEDELRESMTAEEKFQAAGAEQFFKFEKRVENLDQELRNFANAARQLGSSVGILSSAFKLRERLTKNLFLFRENAASLFPRKVTRYPRESLLNPNLMDRKQRHTPWRIYRPTPVTKLIPEDNLLPESLPSQFQSFARDVATFLKCLNDFPEFTDEAVNQSIRAFEGDLKYWASCLEEHKSQFRSPAVQRYVHDLISEIGDHVDNITVTLSMFIKIGVPTIKFHQQQSVAHLLNLATATTFFSAVTASTLQLSSSSTGTVLSDVVNAFWFSSLVFSIAASANCFLGLIWRQAMYHSPGHRVPWWVLIWIKRVPLVCLVMSVACFSSGLVLFTYSSHQGPVTSTIITVLTVITSFGFAAVSAWFASERWMFTRYSGQKWLEDAIFEFTNYVADRLIVRAARFVTDWSCRCIAAVFARFKRLAEWVNTTPARQERAELPLYGDPCQPRAFRHPIPPPNRHNTQEIIPPLPHQEIAFSSCSDLTEHRMSADERSEDSVANGQSHARQRFVNAIRTVIMLQSQTTGTARPMSPRRDSTGETPQLTSPGRCANPGVQALRNNHMAANIEKLKMLGPVQELTVHQALVRHLQFSPNGKYLATSSWDRTSVIFRVGQSGDLATHHVLVHSRGFIVQVAWSPNGRMLLTRLTRSVKVWTEDGVLKKTIERPNGIQSIIWLPNNDAFLSVEGSEVVKLDLTGKILDTYNLGQVRLHNVAVTKDCVRLVGVGPSIASPGGFHPSRHTRVEKRIIVYNMERKRKESQIPFANDVRDVTMARRVSVVLVSPEKAPPQLWKVEIVRDRDNNCLTSRLTLKHTFVLKVHIDFAGPCYFGGSDDQFVWCAGKAGDIHIWDRDSAALLRCICPPTPSMLDLTCIAWNYATDEPFSFATGSHDGAVCLWSTSAPLEPDAKSESSYGHTEGDQICTDL